MTMSSQAHETRLNPPFVYLPAAVDPQSPLLRGRQPELTPVRENIQIPVEMPEPGTFRIINRYSTVGRTRVLLLCNCGYLSYAYVWSWAGNGSKRCLHCGARLMYQGLPHTMPGAVGVAQT